MMQLELKNHPVWCDLTDILEHLDCNALVKEHLEVCDYKVCGYWDEQDQYYDEIALPRSLEAELVSSSIEVTHVERYLKLSFVLKVVGDVADNAAQNSQKLGELRLVYNENLEFINENWLLEVESLLLRIEQE
jgi:hypothetical protein